MIMNRADRGNVVHERAMFDPIVLTGLRDHLLAIESRKNVAADLNERERAAVERGESSDALRMDSRWYEVWRTLSPAGRALLGPFSLVRFPVQVRHVRGESHKVPWHQDAGYIRLLGTNAPRQVITCFIPLDPDPQARTTLQFAELESNGEFEHRKAGAFGAGIEQLAPKRVYHFDLALGDALVFGDHAVHRTYTAPGAKLERCSLEFRLLTPEDGIEGRDYFDVDTSRFIQKGATDNRP
jgi:hypothetical protein